MSWLPDLSAIREVVVSKAMASSELLQLATDKDIIQEEIQKLNMELKEILAVLDDAEERQMKEKLLKDWLTDLQNSAYDVEDVVYEFETEIGKRNLMMERRGSSSKIRRLVLDPHNNAVMFNKDVTSKIKELTAKLKHLESQKNMLQLRMLDDSERPKRLELERLQPTSVEIEAHLYGRDKDKQTILDQYSPEIPQFAAENEVQAEIQKLNKALNEIRAVLNDAEERQMKEQQVKDWLTDLQNLAYDVEDVLDEFATEIGSRNLMMEHQGSTSKGPWLDTPDNAVVFNRDMMSKMKELTDKLKDLEPQKNQLQLRMIGYERPKRVLKQRLQPTFVEIETRFYGRDKDKQTILDLLLKSDDDDEGNFVIPIVGMGGIGKTTLAQLVYNDASIQTHFDIKAWVCVSEDFDVFRITKEILQSITLEPCDDNDLNKLQDKLYKALLKKKFLIVLDDVCNHNYHDWIILQSPFLTRISGSKIIVTTRSLGVSSSMGAPHAHSLDILSFDDCLTVFAHHALGATDFSGHPSLKEVGEKMVRKCNGFPLAAKSLGSLLRTNVNLDAWEDILESETWKPSEEHCWTIPALQLSYRHLPLHLKRCFVYCSILPKEYEFEEEEVILLWRAQGFLQEARDKQGIDDLGRKYFRNLVSRSLFQKSVKDGSRFVVPNLINDLAQSVAGEICFKIEGDRQITKHARHLSYIAEKFDGIKKFEGIGEAPRHLRTFLPLRLSKDGEGYVTNHVLTYLLPKLRLLRALSLKGYQIEELDFVGDLKQLRYLNVSNNRVMKSLPESVSTLYNLETLLLRKCECLEKLPLKMENLVNLCHLDITGACVLEGMPSNFSMLTSLQTLSNFVLAEGKGYQIRELKDLSSLKGQLCISGLQNVSEPQDAFMAKLHDKSGLEKLELHWNKDVENRRQEVDKKVLDVLQPSKNLKELTIKSYCGAVLSNWVGDSFCSDLQSLCLTNCPNILSLPSVGKLLSLRKIHIKGLKSVTSVGIEFFGESTTNAFPSLEILQFEDMPRWEKWSLYEVDEEARKFPRLRELLIQNCPLLLGSVPECLPSLEKLTIGGCEKLTVSIQSFPLLTELEIERCHKVVYKGFAEDSSLKRVCFSRISKFSCAAECLMVRSTKVESLEIDDCEHLCSFRENNWGWLTQSMSVGALSIGGCPQIVSIGAEEERERLKIPYNVQEMIICDFSRLEKLSTTLHSLTSLTVVELYDCPKLISLARSNLPLNLKVLDIQSCGNLESLMLDEGENVNSSNTCVLEQLAIYYCPSLKRINRSELPSTLKKLYVTGCSRLESIAHEIQDNSSLVSIFIYNCPGIKELPPGLNELKHLQRMRIVGCSNLICFPESGLPTTTLKELRLGYCKRLQALPENMHSLNSLETLEIIFCPNVAFEGIPTRNLKSLFIEGPNMYKAIMECGGFHTLTSLQSLWIKKGCPDASVFPQEKMEITLPSSLTHLEIVSFPKLEILSSNGFRNLTSLECLTIKYCPNLKFLPGKDMLSSLLQLHIEKCPMLEEECKRDEGSQWSNIAHVPYISSCLQTSGSLLPLKIDDNWSKPQQQQQKETVVSTEIPTDLHSFRTERYRSDDNQTVPPQVSPPSILLQSQDENQTKPSSSSEDGKKRFSSDLNTLRIDRFPSDMLPEEILKTSSSLQRLYLFDCVPLKIFPISPSLKTLFIHNCKSLEFPQPTKPIMNNILEDLFLGSSCDSMEIFPFNYFPKLKYLNLMDCKNLEYLSVDEELQNELTSLDYLLIKDCPKLRSIILRAPKLTSLVLSNCVSLKSLQPIQSFKSLRSLFLKKCPALESFLTEELPSGLIIFCIYFCDKITPQKGWKLDQLLSLSHFEIEGGCQTLKSFPEEGLLPANLNSLRISGLVSLTTLDGEGLQKLTSLHTLEINSCNKLDSLPEHGLLPSSLSKLSITNCSLLNPKLRNRRGREWSKIARIRSVQVDEDSD